MYSFIVFLTFRTSKLDFILGEACANPTVFSESHISFSGQGGRIEGLVSLASPCEGSVAVS